MTSGGTQQKVGRATCSGAQRHSVRQRPAVQNSAVKVRNSAGIDNNDNSYRRTDNPTLESSHPVPIMLASTQQTRVLAKVAWAAGALARVRRAGTHS